MVLAGLDPEYAAANPDIKKKTQTIRATRKRPFKQGDKLYHFTGMRTSNCERLGESEAKQVLDIHITERIHTRVPMYSYPVTINGMRWPEKMVLDMVLDMAVSDGFESTTHFIEFFKATHGLPFEGQIIKW